jgi:hypothetical protein
MIGRLILALALAPAGAFAFKLSLPVDCVLDQTCYIQQYPDHDPGRDAQDFTCGGLSYDGHDGTDFALPTRAAMNNGVAVLAAAPGVVKGRRDGVEDFLAPVAGRDCGNGVVIDHETGWQTQYCHLRKGSVLVAPGQQVARGQVLGMIGQSGAAAFPHLHLSVRQNTEEVDPFAPDRSIMCDTTAKDRWAKDLWTNDIIYRPGGILQAGFADAIPGFNAVKAGISVTELPPSAPALVAWAYLYGTQSGDAVVFKVVGPKGAILTERSELDRTQALSFRAAGRKLTADEWPEGEYHAEIRLMRGQLRVDEVRALVRVSP